MEDPSDHEVKLCLLPDLHRDNNASATTITTATTTKRSNPFPPPPPFQISQQQPLDEEDPDITSTTTTTFLFPTVDSSEDSIPHHQYSTFMLNFLVALTFGLLIISVLSAMGCLETTAPSPIFNVQSASVKHLTLTNTSSSQTPHQPVIAASGLAISLHIDNPYPYSKMKVSLFQGCDLLGELVVPENKEIGDVDLGPRGTKKPSTNLDLNFGGKVMRLRVADWISMDVARNQAIGVSSFGVKIVAAVESLGGAAEQLVEMWCGSVFLGFSTDPLAGRLLFGPATCRRVNGGAYRSDCI